MLRAAGSGGLIAGEMASRGRGRYGELRWANHIPRRCWAAGNHCRCEERLASHALFWVRRHDHLGRPRVLDVAMNAEIVMRDIET